MPELLNIFAGNASPALNPLRDKKGRELITPQAEAEWLRKNPQNVARIRRVEIPLGRGLVPNLGLTVPTFFFSVRVYDHRQNDGWRLATLSLPAAVNFSYDGDQSLDDVWPELNQNLQGKNEFVLRALDEAAYTGEGVFGAVLELLVLPDPSALDPEGPWAEAFRPYAPA